MCTPTCIFKLLIRRMVHLHRKRRNSGLIPNEKCWETYVSLVGATRLTLFWRMCQRFSPDNNCLVLRTVVISSMWFMIILGDFFGRIYTQVSDDVILQITWLLLLLLLFVFQVNLLSMTCCMRPLYTSASSRWMC